jgi:hypothetical protein
MPDDGRESSDPFVVTRRPTPVRSRTAEGNDSGHKDGRDSIRPNSTKRKR